jgi:hypothetical protein
MADIGVSPKVGTLGAGVVISKGYSEKFSINIDLNTFSYDTTENENNIDYDFEFDLQTIGLLGNYHPFGGSFRLTAGMYINNNEFNLTGKPNAGGTFEIGNATYTAAQVGTLTGRVAFDSTAPYVGIGWGNRPEKHFGFTLDIGALYQGSPELTLQATGALANPALAADVERERQELQNDLDDFKWYPVVSLGLYFRF